METMSNFYNKTSKVEHNGRTIELGSHEEMRFYRHLQRRDDVESFDLQVPYELMPGYEIERAGKKKRIQGISYVADFVVTYKDGHTSKKMFNIPRTFILRESDFSSLDNIDFDMVYDEIITSQTSEELKEYTFYFMQEMISGYEQRQKNKNLLLDCIQKSLSFLNKTVQEYAYNELINKIEAIKC